MSAILWISGAWQKCLASVWVDRLPRVLALQRCPIRVSITSWLGSAAAVRLRRGVHPGRRLQQLLAAIEEAAGQALSGAISTEGCSRSQTSNRPYTSLGSRRGHLSITVNHCQPVIACVALSRFIDLMLGNHLFNVLNKLRRA